MEEGSEQRERGDLTPMMPAEEGMSFRTGFIRITALPCCSASSTCSHQLSGHGVRAGRGGRWWGVGSPGGLRGHGATGGMPGGV